MNRHQTGCYSSDLYIEFDFLCDNKYKGTRILASDINTYAGMCPCDIPFTRRQYTAITSLVINGYHNYLNYCHIEIVDDGFFLACEDLVRMFDHLFYANALFYLFIVEVETSSPTLIPLFRPESVHSGLASLDDCGRMFPDKLRVSSFPCLDSGIVSSLRLRWVKGVCVFRCNLSSALLAE